MVFRSQRVHELIKVANEIRIIFVRICQFLVTPISYSTNVLKPSLLKVSKFQNEFMKSSFLPKYERKIVRISARLSVAQYRVEILTIFHSYFGRNNKFLNSFWNLLTKKKKEYNQQLLEPWIVKNWKQIVGNRELLLPNSVLLFGKCTFCVNFGQRPWYMMNSKVGTQT